MKLMLARPLQKLEEVDNSIIFIEFKNGKMRIEKIATGSFRLWRFSF